MVRRILLFVTVAVLHFLLQCHAWMFHPGNAAPGGGKAYARIAWPVLSFPWVGLLPEPLASGAAFWPSMIVNSVSWSFFVVGAIQVFRALRRSPGTVPGDSR
ncbi:MAG TPA: hypothetical protein VJY35_03590 [Candidatus Eisenbacteria bacterium]|nr:hypothetical protein [Candidatus Eisenbacteria bacterium]